MLRGLSPNPPVRVVPSNIRPTGIMRVPVKNRVGE